MNDYTTTSNTVQLCPCCEKPMRDDLQTSFRTGQTYHLYTCDNSMCQVRGLTADEALLEELRNNPAKLNSYKRI